ncbi:hypothetical protein GRI36_11670 [Altererythrobacter gangjinensis]|uniref:DUF6265 domain-containing protein n=1 Tax=Pontixanthobacter gangjinensis TaxID=1028742 RepID=A0A6I4SR78_9SPHN|nr:hypothetical protein [Pontixanthobacter gangjinensis]
MGLAIGALVASGPLFAHELPVWMAGCWVQTQDDQWTEECWTGARAGIMLGSSRTGQSENLRFWETMQIVLDQENEDGPVWPMVIWASPLGEQRTMFTFEPGDAPGVSFVNEANDYPQRIRYWREGELLKAEISMLDGSNSRTWTYRAMGSGD